MKRGKKIEASLEHLVLYPEKTANAHPTIIALHGRGTDEHDLLPLVESLGLSDVLIISPRAPFPFRPGFIGGFAWYSMGEVGAPDQDTFHESVSLLRRFLDEASEHYPIDTSRVLLLGFSQGAVMAYAVGLQEPRSFLGIVALSGYIPHKSGLPLQLQQLDDFPIFISHGSHDELIPVQFGRESAELLKAGGADAIYREYAMGHEVNAETLRDLSRWMNKVLL